LSGDAMPPMLVIGDWWYVKHDWQMRCEKNRRLVGWLFGWLAGWLVDGNFVLLRKREQPGSKQSVDSLEVPRISRSMLNEAS